MYFKVTGILFSASEELTFSTYQQFFKETGIEKTRFIIHGPSRVNHIVKYLAVFSVGPKVRDGPYKRFGLFFKFIFLRVGSQTGNDSQNSGAEIVYRKQI